MKSKVSAVHILLIISILLIILSAWITYQNSKIKKESTAWIIHTYQVIQNATNLQLLVESLETDQRGYIITRDSSFLRRYQMTKNDVKVTFDSLTNLIGSDDARADLLENHIALSIEKRESTLEDGMRLLHEKGIHDASAFIAEKIGKAEMDKLRLYIKDLVNQEKRLLNKRNDLFERKSKNEDLVRLAAFVTIGLTSVLAFFSLVKKTKHIDDLLLSLKKANESLEQKVAERTSELKAEKEQTNALNEQLIRLNKDKDHFIGIASHDLKAPLSGIMGIIRLMKTVDKDRSSADLEYLNYMEDACVKMQRLTSNLLDINRIERGMTFINKQQVNIKDLLTSVEREFSEAAAKKSIQLCVDKVDGFIITDQDALKRIFDNLVSNAIKFSPRGKSVQVHTVLNDGALQCDIQDQGPGIPEDDMPHLFQKFHRLSNKPTNGEDSTGLGLSIVKELTTLLGGKLDVHSKVGKGTTFTLQLPVNG